MSVLHITWVIGFPVLCSFGGVWFTYLGSLAFLCYVLQFFSDPQVRYQNCTSIQTQQLPVFLQFLFVSHHVFAFVYLQEMKPTQTSDLVPFCWIVVRAVFLYHSLAHLLMRLTFHLLSPLTSMRQGEPRHLGHFAASSVPRKLGKKYFLFT